ncbi:MAG: hypothetical protein ABI548_15700 [Polyangiaceae bacterium]
MDDVAKQVEVLAPSAPATERTVDLFRRKSLKPFDELVLGAVLTDASDRHAIGESPVYFSNLNTRDFEPTTGNELAGEYQRSDLLTYRRSTFDVP